MAGESARDLARRNREKAERLLRVAQTYERGAQGEEATAEALAGLPTDQWRVLHDLRWPGRRYANIDHVVVGPGGIFVIDSKHWSGRVEVRGDVLMQNGRRREKAVASAADSAIAVAELLPGLNPELVTPVLCFVRDEPFVGWARDVIVCSTSNVVAMLESRKPVFVQPEVQRQFLRLQGAMSSATLPARSADTANPLPARGASRFRESLGGTTPSSSRSRSQRPRSRTRKKGLGSLIASLLVIVGVAVASHAVLNGMTKRVVESQAGPSVGAGRPFAMNGSQTLPPLAIAESRIVPASPRKADHVPPPAQRLWAVRFVIRNRGPAALAAPWPITARVIDEQRVSHRAETRVTAIRQGRLLPVARPLAAGKAASGFLVFQLPAANKISEVRITYGAEKARWKVAVAPG